MKRSIIFTVILAFVILTGCSNNSSDAPATEVTANPQAEEIETPEVKPEIEVKKEKKLSLEEQLAIQYVNVYLNGTDIEAKKKFVDEQVHPETKQVLELAVSVVTAEDKRFLNPRVVETTDFENAGKKGTLTLVEGDGDKEFIALIMDDKFGWGFISTETNEGMKKSFEEMRSKF
ncbi:hypothetical protein ACP8HI_13635 [Paenibacillus sp. FA6]|uniref:hypothetical protein n=1 Tax=Paenibacillus sp. FA6 TaxID=3413029 RepID=UPI003F658D88